MLKVEGLSVIIENNKIVDDVSFVLEEQDVFMVVGPNGAGKTTLFRAIMGVISHEGRVLINDNDIKRYSKKELAKKIGVLTQKHQMQFTHSIYDVVSLGRYAHQKSFFSRLDSNDRQIIDQSLKLTGLFDIKGRNVLTLSGGELQRTFLAQVFAQDPQILILDEPTTHLDLQYQIAIFDIIKKWAKNKGKAVLSVVHDLNIAFAYGNKALLLDQGRVYSKGLLSQALARDNLKAVYKVDVAQWMNKLLGYWEI